MAAREGSEHSSEVDVLARLCEEARASEDRAERAEARCAALASAQAASVQDHEVAIRAVSSDVAAVCSAHRQQILKISEAMTELGRDLSTRLERLEEESAAQRQRLLDFAAGRALQVALGEKRPEGGSAPAAPAAPALDGDGADTPAGRDQRLQAHELELRELRAQGDELREQHRRLSCAVSQTLRRVGESENSVFGAVVDRLRLLAERVRNASDEQVGAAIAALLAPMSSPACPGADGLPAGSEDGGEEWPSSVLDGTLLGDYGSIPDEPTAARRAPGSSQRAPPNAKVAPQTTHLDSAVPSASPGNAGGASASLRRQRQHGRHQPVRAKPACGRGLPGAPAAVGQPDAPPTEADLELERMHAEVHELEVQLEAARLATGRLRGVEVVGPGAGVDLRRDAGAPANLRVRTIEEEGVCNGMGHGHAGVQDPLAAGHVGRPRSDPLQAEAARPGSPPLGTGKPAGPLAVPPGAAAAPPPGAAERGDAAPLPGQARQAAEAGAQGRPHVAAAPGAPPAAQEGGSSGSTAPGFCHLPRMASATSLGVQSPAAWRPGFPFGVAAGPLGHAPPQVAMPTVRAVGGDAGPRATTPTPGQIHGGVAMVPCLAVGSLHSPRGHMEPCVANPPMQGMPPPPAPSGPHPARLLRASSSTPPPSGRGAAGTAPWASLRPRPQAGGQ